MLLLSSQGDGARHVNVGDILSDGWRHWVATVGLDLKRADIGFFEVAVLDLLNAANLQANIVEVVLVSVGKLAEVESNALSCSSKLTTDGNGLPLGRERDVAQRIIARPIAWRLVNLRRGIGSLVGTHVGSEHIACAT